MRPSKIRMLIKLVEESGIDELEVSSWGRKVCIRKKVDLNGDHKDNPGPAIEQLPRQEKSTKIEITPGVAEQPVTRTELVEIKSPMVGTFYKAPAPDAKPYAEVGQTIKNGQVVCIIEAMKLMNEIESETSGRIVEVLVKNAKPVQFGQALFLVEPA
ncbi:MAG: acetyl-CoA carboxylase biotin carboxyl carrier protein [candidate division Zixibacteria bacterium]